MHPGQITFFEYKSSQFGKALLATSNGDLKDIFLWDIYGRDSPGLLDDTVAHAPDMSLNVPKNYEVENMRWANTDYKLYATMKNENVDDDCILTIYDVPEGNHTTQKLNSQSDDVTRASKIKKNNKIQFNPSHTQKLPINISYFGLNDSNKNIIYGSNATKKFSIDIRDPKSITYFIDDAKDNKPEDKEDSMVEYNQNNYITFANCLQKTIEIYDIRQVS